MQAASSTQACSGFKSAFQTSLQTSRYQSGLRCRALFRLRRPSRKASSARIEHSAAKSGLPASFQAHQGTGTLPSQNPTLVNAGHVMLQFRKYMQVSHVRGSLHGDMGPTERSYTFCMGVLLYAEFSGLSSEIGKVPAQKRLNP